VHVKSASFGAAVPSGGANRGKDSAAEVIIVL